MALTQESFLWGMWGPDPLGWKPENLNRGYGKGVGAWWPDLLMLRWGPLRVELRACVRQLSRIRFDGQGGRSWWECL